jgi:hypothetical protein
VNSMKFVKLTGILLVTTLVSGCGELVREGRSPSQLVIVSLEGASGSTPTEFGNPLQSDIETIVERNIDDDPELERVPTVFNDLGEVTMRIVLKDQGVPGIAPVPSPINQVTINRYRVRYLRSDRPDPPTQGVDVPFSFDGAVTFTVPADGTATAAFELVRNVAKREAPLAGLVGSPVLITTIAEVTFFGRDQAGNDVSAVGRITVTFGNFAD